MDSIYYNTIITIIIIISIENNKILLPLLKNKKLFTIQIIIFIQI